MSYWVPTITIYRLFSIMSMLYTFVASDVSDALYTFQPCTSHRISICVISTDSATVETGPIISRKQSQPTWNSRRRVLSPNCRLCRVSAVFRSFSCLAVNPLCQLVSNFVMCVALSLSLNLWYISTHSRKTRQENNWSKIHKTKYR